MVQEGSADNFELDIIDTHKLSESLFQGHNTTTIQNSKSYLKGNLAKSGYIFSWKMYPNFAKFPFEKLFEFELLFCPWNNDSESLWVSMMSSSKLSAAPSCTTMY